MTFPAWSRFFVFTCLPRMVNVNHGEDALRLVKLGKLALGRRHFFRLGFSVFRVQADLKKRNFRAIEKLMVNFVHLVEPRLYALLSVSDLPR